MKKAAELFVGIDVSKTWLDIAIHEQTETFRVSNDNLGLVSLVERLKTLIFLQNGSRYLIYCCSRSSLIKENRVISCLEARFFF